MTSHGIISAFSPLASPMESNSAPAFSAVPVRKIMSEPAETWRKSVRKRLAELATLEQGWDGYRGVPVASENAVFAFRIIEAICGTSTPSPQIVPGSAGDLQIEWHTLNGDIELHVAAPNKVHAWCSIVGENDDGVECELTNDFRSVAAWVREVTESKIASTAAVA